MNEQFKKIENDVLKRITPTKEERKQLKEIIDSLTKILKTEIENKNLPATTELVGSTAKDTYLKNSLDIDLFLVYPTNLNKQEIARNTLKIGRSILKKTEECYAEHPYIRGIYQDHKIEIVPCYKIENATQKLSAVDRTPLHTSFITKHLKESQKNDVRLFKQFLKGINCYGAEAEIEGFSGYLCEILILKYGSFRNIISNAKDWKKGIKISLGKKDIKSFRTPLIFIDPVDSNRNVASALSKNKFELFISACKEYLKKPKTTFFFPKKPKPWTIEKIKLKIKNENAKYIGLTFEKPDIISENLYPQVRKTARAVEKACKQYGFKIYDTDFFIDYKHNLIYIIIKTDHPPLTKSFTHTGPPIKYDKNVKEFLDKWKSNSRVLSKPFEKNGRLYINVERKFRTIESFLKENLTSLSTGKHIDNKIAEKFDILNVNALLTKKLTTFWTRYLDNRMPWEIQ